jgi:hypothetical protein
MQQSRYRAIENGIVVNVRAGVNRDSVQDGPSPGNKATGNPNKAIPKAVEGTERKEQRT